MSYRPYDQTRHIKKSNRSSRKLVLHGNMAENHVKALSLRVNALNEQIKTNNEYTRKLEKQLVEKNLEIEKLKKESINNIINNAKSSSSEHTMNKSSLLYIMQA